MPDGRSVDTTNRWVETRRSLPGDRMIRIAATSRRPSGGLIVGCLYLPNGNPASGPKFDYKLRLFERLTGYSKSFGQRRAGSDLARNRKFESISLQRRVLCETDSSRERRCNGSNQHDPLNAFSAYAAVALLALTGAINSLLLVGSLGAMFGTPYGRLLAFKILLFPGDGGGVDQSLPFCAAGFR